MPGSKSFMLTKNKLWPHSRSQKLVSKIPIALFITLRMYGNQYLNLFQNLTKVGQNASTDVANIVRKKNIATKTSQASSTCASSLSNINGESQEALLVRKCTCKAADGSVNSVDGKERYQYRYRTLQTKLNQSRLP
jgi:hypothetical protein